MATFDYTENNITYDKVVTPLNVGFRGAGQNFVTFSDANIDSIFTGNATFKRMLSFNCVEINWNSANLYAEKKINKTADLLNTINSIVKIVTGKFNNVQMFDFNNVDIPGTLVSDSQYAKYAYNKTMLQNFTDRDMTSLRYFMNGIEIDWNDATLCDNTKLNSTVDLLGVLQKMITKINEIV